MADSQILVRELRVETEVGAEGDKYRDHERADIPWDPLDASVFFFFFLSNFSQTRIKYLIFVHSPLHPDLILLLASLYSLCFMYFFFSLYSAQPLLAS